jgi:hypothetical protein
MIFLITRALKPSFSAMQSSSTTPTRLRTGTTIFRVTGSRFFSFPSFSCAAYARDKSASRYSSYTHARGMCSFSSSLLASVGQNAMHISSFRRMYFSMCISSLVLPEPRLPITSTVDSELICVSTSYAGRVTLFQSNSGNGSSSSSSSDLLSSWPRVLRVFDAFGLVASLSASLSS